MEKGKGIFTFPSAANDIVSNNFLGCGWYGEGEFSEGCRHLYKMTFKQGNLIKNVFLLLSRAFVIML